jgi:rubrerythrin
MGGDKFPYLDTPISHGKSVVVIGAGNTAMDCLRVAKRLGAPTVRCVYRRTEAEAPARIEEIRHAKEEGIEFFFLHSPVEILISDTGDVRGMKVQKMELGEPDDKGRRKPVPLDEFVELECDTVIYALGTNANPIVAQATPGLSTNKWGYIVANDDTQATSLQGVFAGGDIVTGGATVILAMGAGRRAAKAIGSYLQSKKSIWPITKEDMEAFVPPTPLTSAASGPHAIGGQAMCPKCHRTVEGEEEYVCCADATLQWRCSSCAKVSEGFAFPYGMCPHCGGKLEAVDATKIDSDAAMQAIRTAFEIELGGRAFYARAAAQSTDSALKALFGKFAAMENEHMETLSKRYHVDMPKEAEGFTIDLAAVRVGFTEKPTDAASLFKLSIAFEERAVKFFEGQSAKVRPGSAEELLYKELAAEEREHVATLTTEFERWKSGKAGMM